MGNSVSDRVGNYVIETSSDLGNFVIADMGATNPKFSADGSRVLEVRQDPPHLGREFSPSPSGEVHRVGSLDDLVYG